MDPLLPFVEVDVPQAMSLDHGQLLVLPFPQMGVDHHRPVVAGVEEIGIVAIALHGADDAIKLPGGRRATGEKEMPGDVDLESRFHLGIDHLPVAGQVHQLVVVRQNRPRGGLEDGDAAAAHLACFGRGVSLPPALCSP